MKEQTKTPPNMYGRRYKVVNSKGETIEEFRQKSAADKFAKDKSKDMFGEKFEVKLIWE